MTEEVWGTERAIVARFIRRKPAPLAGPAVLPVGWTIGRPIRRVGAQQGHQPLIKVLVNPPQLIVSRHVVGGEAEPGEHNHEDKAMPRLEPPADGVEDHSMA
jgi:hypothetical protein